jgi:hypothetical protein
MDPNQSRPTASSGGGDTVVPTPLPANEPLANPRKRFGWLFRLALIGAALVAIRITYSQIAENRIRSKTEHCVHNLMAFRYAMEHWAQDHHLPDTTRVVPDNLADYVKGYPMPDCPGGGTYSLTTVREGPRCSLSSYGHSL